MEIRQSAIKAMFLNRYPWAEDVFCFDHTDWDEPHFLVELNDDGVNREFKVKIEIEEVK